MLVMCSIIIAPGFAVGHDSLLHLHGSRFVVAGVERAMYLSRRHGFQPGGMVFPLRKRICARNMV